MHNDLIFCRHEIEKFSNDETLTKLFVSFSRDDPDSKHRYVQDSLRLVESDFVNLLFGTEESILYVCGDAQNMSKDVNQAIILSTAKILGRCIILSLKMSS